MPADALLQVVGELCESFSGITHDHFGSCEGFAGRKGIGEFLLHQAELHSGLSDLVHARAAAEPAAVYKLHGITASRGFGRISAGQDHHGIIMMRGHSSPASDPLLHMRHRRSLEVPLQAVASVKCDQVKISADKIQIRAHYLLQPELSPGSVADQRASCDDIEFRKNAVQKRHFHKACCVLKCDLQCLSRIFLSVNSRQPFQTVFTIQNSVTGKSQITSVRPVSVFHSKGRASHVACSRYGELLRKQIQRIGAVSAAVIYIGGKSSVRVRKQVLHRAPAPSSVVKMQEHAVFVRLHLICRISSMYCKKPSVLSNRNRHCISFSQYGHKFCFVQSHYNYWKQISAIAVLHAFISLFFIICHFLQNIAF